MLSENPYQCHHHHYPYLPRFVTKYVGERDIMMVIISCTEYKLPEGKNVCSSGSLLFPRAWNKI